MSLFFRAPLEVEVKLDGEGKRKVIESKSHDGQVQEMVPVFERDESVRGSIVVRPRDSRKVEHMGIKVQFVGTIELKTDKKQSDDFISMTQELAAPGELRLPETYSFEFKNVEKQFESYNGYRVRLRYFIRVTLYRRMSDLVRERDIWVLQYDDSPDSSSLIKMDVGIEDCLHIEFEYSKARYSLTDVIVGRIYFLLVRLKLKHMELSLIRKETIGTPPNHQNETENIVRYEIMDGAPVKGETIPIRLFLSGFDLVPTMRDVNKKFSCRTYLSLVLIDDAGRRYFKQSEITLIRRRPSDVPT